MYRMNYNTHNRNYSHRNESIKNYLQCNSVCVFCVKATYSKSKDRLKSCKLKDQNQGFIYTLKEGYESSSDPGEIVTFYISHFIVFLRFYNVRFAMSQSLKNRTTFLGIKSFAYIIWGYTLTFDKF